MSCNSNLVAKLLSIPQFGLTPNEHAINYWLVLIFAAFSDIFYTQLNELCLRHAEMHTRDRLKGYVYLCNKEFRNPFVLAFGLESQKGYRLDGKLTSEATALYKTFLKAERDCIVLRTWMEEHRFFYALSPKELPPSIRKLIFPNAYKRYSGNSTRGEAKGILWKMNEELIDYYLSLELLL